MNLVESGGRVHEIFAALYLLTVLVVLCLEACAHERHELAAVRYRCRLHGSKLCVGGVEHAYALEEVAQTALVVREVEGRLPLKVFTIKGLTREAHLHTFVDNRARVDRHHDVTASVRETWRCNLVLCRAVIVGPIQSQSSVQEAQLSTNLPCCLDLWLEDRVALCVDVAHTGVAAIVDWLLQIGQRGVGVSVLTYLCPAGAYLSERENVVLRQQLGEHESAAHRRIEIRAVVERQRR